MLVLFICMSSTIKSYFLLCICMQIISELDLIICNTWPHNIHWFVFVVLWPGLLSKSRGQVLRVAAVLHILFKLKNFDNPDLEENDELQDKDEAEQEKDDEITISTSAMKAAVNFVILSCQQTCLIAGKKKIEEVICLTAKSKSYVMHCNFRMYILTNVCKTPSIHRYK